MSNPNFIQIFKSIIAAATGIQSDKNRKKDFENGYLPYFIVGGLIFTLLFILGISFLVSLVTMGCCRFT